MNVIDLRESKGEDFTVFLFEDAAEGTEIMFRLRRGHATLKDMTNGFALISDRMTGFDGTCTFIDAQNWAEKHDITLNLLVQ